MHYFQSSLKAGQAGEELFHSLMPHLTRLDGRKSDFIDKMTGETYELKTDSYSMDSTPNFFIEFMSNIEKGTKGGPWQAKANASTFFVYMYPKSKTMFIFKTDLLVNVLECMVQDFKMIHIPNRTWTTGGFKIHRDALKEYAYKKEWL